ncbi:MAG: hypothetical protein KatS3mg130_1795 [Candidatus Sumerlaea sp.]|nr:MAG: hypothetical protein KatS3mg130_1795 [Candidatus Sumerlaea sp.]
MRLGASIASVDSIRVVGIDFQTERLGDLAMRWFDKQSRAVQLWTWLVLVILGTLSAHATATTSLTSETVQHLKLQDHGGAWVRTTGLSPVSEKFGRDTETSLPSLFDPAKMMRVSDLRPGMKGYGLTVFSGIRPERFEVEIVGVHHRRFPGDDMILCQLAHPMLRDIGVVAGMSGSPVFVDDKLIGAVAYGWTFAKEPLAGVTPIETMLRVMEVTHPNLRDPEEDAPGSMESFRVYREMRETVSVKPLPKAVAPDGMRRVVRRDELIGEPQKELPETFTLEPLSLPIFTNCRSPLSLRIAETLLGSSALFPMVAGATSGNDPAMQAENAPGGPVTDLAKLSEELSGGYGLAVPLLEGDLCLAGIGTVTYRQGNRLIAFGHPMFEFGIVSYPMAPARVQTVVRNIARPFKLGEALGQVGAIRQDRTPAVGGVFGEFARMFPIEITVTDPEYRGTRHFSCRVWENRDYGPRLAMMAITESMAATGRSGGQAAVLYEYTFAFDDGTSITKENYLADEYGGGTAGVIVGSELGMLMTNPFKKVRPQKVDFRATVVGRFPEAELRTAHTDKSVYRPGETVQVTLELLPYRKSKIVQKAQLTLPQHLPDGDYQLVITDAAGREVLELERNPALGQISDYDALVRYLRRNFPRNRVYVVCLDRDTGSSVRGQELARLPSSIITTLEQSTESQNYAPIAGNVVVDVDAVTDFEIQGRLTLPITISRKGRD